MSSMITVKAKEASIPSSTDADKQAKKELDDVVNKLVGPTNDAKAGKFPLPGITNVVGYGAQDVQNASVNEMIPATVKAKVGEKVPWAIRSEERRVGKE